ncbi:MAG: PEP-CTERM sorting domain-containing protein [Terriglobia bacterium]
MKSRSMLLALAIALLLPLSVFATPITGELDFTGNVTATLTSLNFLCNQPGGPACSSGQGNFLIEPTSTGSFAGLSTISSAAFGHVMDISNSTTPPGTTVSVSNFLTLPGGITFTLTKLNLGTGGACPPAPGATCTPTSSALVTPSNPLGKTGTIFEDTATGSSAEDSVNALAFMSSSSGQTTEYTGTLSATFNGKSTAQVLAELSNNGSITTPYSATFTPVSTTTTVPEPSTASLALLGLLLVGCAVGVRRFSHC